MDPRNQWGPRFDGSFSAGTQVNQNLNAKFGQLNATQAAWYNYFGQGYPPVQPIPVIA
jgi:hypothetical protein